MRYREQTYSRRQRERSMQGSIQGLILTVGQKRAHGDASAQQKFNKLINYDILYTTAT